MITVEKKFATKIEKYLKNFHETMGPPDNLNIELVVFPEEEEPMVVLRQLHHKITTDIIVMEGNTLLDIPLDEVMDTHVQSKASLTVTMKEFDMDKQGKGPKLEDAESSDIFGLSSMPDILMRQGQHSQYQYHRVVLKSNKQEAQSGKVSLKQSLLRK